MGAFLLPKQISKLEEGIGRTKQSYPSSRLLLRIQGPKYLGNPIPGGGQVYHRRFPQPTHQGWLRVAMNAAGTELGTADLCPHNDRKACF